MNYKTGFITIQILITFSTLIGFILEDNISNYFLLVLMILGWGFLSLAYATDADYELPPMIKDPNEMRYFGYKKSKDKMKGCYNCNYSRDIENNTFVYCRKHERKVYRNYECRKYRV